MSRKDPHKGKLRIGDDWNAITIIALSQSNPLKAVAEFVENSIDARARNISITRAREKGSHCLRIKDDGAGIPRDAAGQPDFHYVATHICDSIKRRLKAEGAKGVQGEFGIGLLSFWTLGEELVLTSAGEDGRTYQMHMRRGSPDYRVIRKPILLPEPGTELVIRGILPGVRSFSGEKIQWYLASELRDRIRSSGVQVRMIDRIARAEFKVEPRQFEGRLLHGLPVPVTPGNDLYLELYLNESAPENRVGLYRRGTRVLDNLAELEGFQRPPWTSGCLQGLVDAGYLNLTPGTRLGVIHDEGLEQLLHELEPVEAELTRAIEAQQQAAEEKTSREVLRSIQTALKEALLALPEEEYDWFELRKKGDGRRRSPADSESEADALHEDGVSPPSAAASVEPADQLSFFEHPGPLFSVKISPASAVVAVGQSRPLQAMPRDRSRRRIEVGVALRWEILEGEGKIEPADGEIVKFHAPAEPGLVRIQLTASQGEITCQAEALITVTDTLLPPPVREDATHPGIPGYTFEKAPGQLWRSRYDADRNLIVINNGHRDFVFASRNKTLKLRYLCRLFAKELVLRNFLGIPHDQMLERMIELTLYTEEHLK
ncbi:MAG: ATP-binding protein [Verrucomicrobia bacterium]|nr:ATP-binding protein [Verrucomicrobiota bacterium]